MFWKLWQDLEIILAETVNINPGTGLTYDALGVYWDATWGWVDGICHNNAVLAISNKPTQYADSATTSTTGYFGVSYNLPTTTSREIMSLGYDANHPFVNVPSAITSNSSYNTYYCDYYGYGSGSRPVGCAVGYAGADNGAFCFYTVRSWAGAGPSRLCYRPLPA